MSGPTNELLKLIGFTPKDNTGVSKFIIAIDGDTASRLGLTKYGDRVVDDQEILTTVRAAEAVRAMTAFMAGKDNDDE